MRLMLIAKWQHPIERVFNEHLPPQKTLPKWLQVGEWSDHLPILKRHKYNGHFTVQTSVDINLL